MEERIKRMESAIIASGLQGPAGLVNMKEKEKEEEEKTSSDRIESQAKLSNQLANLVIDSNGSSNFIGSASGFSLFSPQGIQWILQKVGDKDELAQLYHILAKHDFESWGTGNTNLWAPKSRSQHSPLPTKEIASEYVNCYFTTFNNVYPVINRDVFDSYFERQYSINPPPSSAWYALLNAVLCLGSIRTTAERERHVRSSRLIDYTSIAHETGVGYFRNASSCFHDLFFSEANLMAMQAITLMMFITTSSPNPQISYTITSAGRNLAYTLGLHRSLDGCGLAPEEIEQRRNVFWVFYQLEKAISHKLGRPSVINDDDIAVELPPKKLGLFRSPSGAEIYDIFQDQITLAIIRSRIYTELYSASSQTKSEEHRLKMLGKLDNHLQRWRDGMPIDIRPEHPINSSDEQYVSVVMMHFTYLDAVILLHRISGHHQALHLRDRKATDIESNDSRQRPLNPRVNASQLLCLAAARRSIQLLDTISSNNLQNQHFMWYALYYPLSASLVLFTNILSNPQDQNAASDVQLMNLITSFIAHSVQPGTSFADTPTLSVFKELYGIATRLVAKVPQRSSQKMKRQPEGDDPATMQAHYSSSSTSGLPLYADSNAQTMTSFALYESLKTYSEPDTTSTVKSSSDANASKQAIQHTKNDSSQFSQQDPSTTHSSPLDLAPFIIPPEQPSLIDFNPTMSYDPLLESGMNFDWDMDDTWISTSELTLEFLNSTDMRGLPLQDDEGAAGSINQGIDYFNRKLGDERNHGHQQQY
ncbi:conserved hypothetical protein [Talaromyces stipitatus ATCC 10500]|uniref:Xylanolytic transcriptional activator regulatory domain-containing protein n=1 Tax=Talaromyces stipitatus (strain ATCC 10500 / CBS 375.48 / QM 6759 / NRRL 1006) TaxID=441959 RepID=B8MJF8_TALSN|nr:uncharacterized protein TSTA_046120 [Talaromyces stipitatus ATCC 10500]EED15158.1 conserved hypothetical protein [Talaromyces stipitatus ATCC 10500]